MTKKSHREAMIGPVMLRVPTKHTIYPWWQFTAIDLALRPHIEATFYLQIENWGVGFTIYKDGSFLRLELKVLCFSIDVGFGFVSPI